MLVTHKHLLDWVTSGKLEISKTKNLFRSYLLMWIEPVLAIAALFYSLIFSQNTLKYAAPILVLMAVRSLYNVVGKQAFGHAQLLSFQKKVILCLQKLSQENMVIFRAIRYPH